ncbi:MAG: UDPGP type 1 family protein [Verrucomicrobia bacterium]|nr:UDPGP type 1 family protein [Verrucomicrobiota bacterium]
MHVSIEEARRVLEDNAQAQVLRFWDRLNAAQRDGLLAQVATLDFAGIARMRRMLDDKDAAPALGELRPAPVTQLDPAGQREARRAGEQALRDGAVGAILVAGGQGTRLGFEGPKGAFPIGPISRCPLFAIHARKILALERKYGAAVPLYIMTSDSNDADTRAFFVRHAYFGLQPAHVHFFMQGMWPALTAEGQIILDRPDHIFMSPDGHGGTISALRAAGLIGDMQRRGLRMLFYFQVDNPLVDVADPVFLGFHASREAQISVKVCTKRDPEEKLGVVVVRDGRSAIVEYTELTHVQKHATLPDGRLQFRHGSVAIHVFSRDFLLGQSEAVLPLHLAHKKVPSCGDDGVPVTPTQPNAYKFEKFIFDVIPNAERALSLEFDRNEEFSPVKNSTGEDSPATVTRDMVRKFARWLEASDVTVPRQADGDPRYCIEIDPVYALTAEDLRAKVSRDLRITGDLLLQEAP